MRETLTTITVATTVRVPASLGLAGLAGGCLEVCAVPDSMARLYRAFGSMQARTTSGETERRIGAL
jgi:hypothetical protein